MTVATQVVREQVTHLLVLLGEKDPERGFLLRDTKLIGDGEMGRRAVVHEMTSIRIDSRTCIVDASHQHAG